jgi:hypothetical protein
MTPKTLITALLACLPVAAWSVSSPVSVEFANPEKFTDVGERHPPSEKMRDAYLDNLRTYILERAGRLLPDGQSLYVSISDVDMAGGFEPWRGAARDVRIIRDIYPPRIALTFKLAASDGSVIKQGERKLIDAGFLVNSDRYASDPLRYEKALIDRWLASELKRPGG